MSLTKLDADEVCSSIYQSYKSVAGPTGIAASKTEEVPVELHILWLGFVNRASAIVETSEGTPIVSIAERLYDAWHHPQPPVINFGSLSLDERLGWEVVARQLAYILDGGDDPMGLQASWVEWAQRKRPTLDKGAKA